MSRYIDAEALLNRLPEDLPYKASVKRTLMQAPTADVVKVKHGEWIVIKEYNDYRMLYEAKNACSVCGHKPKYEGYLSDMEYCPNCGAKMDGERNKNGT